MWTGTPPTTSSPSVTKRPGKPLDSEIRPWYTDPIGREKDNPVKYPNQVTASHIQVTDKEIEALAASLVKAIDRETDGLEYRIVYDGTGDCLKGKWVEFNFANPVVGRDWKRSRVYCTGFGVMLCRDRGPDMAKDANGEVPRPAPVREQYSASFTYFGHETRFRCRRRDGIRDGSAHWHQYDTDLPELDFSENIRYIAGITPEKKRK